MSPEEKARKVVDLMMKNDSFSQWLGIERIADGPGISVLKMVVRGEMNNGFSIAHGGIAYSLADTALAFASNSHGIQAVSIETSISHVAPIKQGDVLIARARELNLTNRTGLYQVSVERGDGQILAWFKGTVYRTGREWEVS